MTEPLLLGCDRCHRPFLILAEIGNLFLCRDCTGGLEPTRLVRAKEDA